MTVTSPTPKPNVLITGSTGLIGTRLQQALKDYYRLIGLDVTPPKKPVPGVDFISCDLTDDANVKHALHEVKTLTEGRLASVAHLAAYYDFAGDPSPLYEQLTVQGTRRLVRGLQDIEMEVEQLVFSSSLLVMQPAEEEQGPITEVSPTSAAWAYPESKLRAEEALRDERDGIPVVILRIAGVYDEEGHSLPLGQQIKRIHEKSIESFLFPGDKSHGQPFVHLDDLVDCFHKVITRRQALQPFELFLVAEPDIMSYEELQEELGRLIHGHEWPAIRIPKSVAKAGAAARKKLSKEEQFIKPWMIDLADAHYPVDIQRAHERLGWNPHHRLRGTLGAIVENLTRDPERWYKQNGLTPPDTR
ncbi:MAG: NAD(P)-dependent oxidoreductase [Candidatus Hydrogenedentes bacterium]|nr:NAD(P)-dependent oxidoreductase [Candidatus Hydrogenedentota bacterium]